jgi:hypothetical protein
MVTDYLLRRERYRSKGTAQTTFSQLPGATFEA